MTTETPVSEFFTAGGTLPPDAPSYVKRSTDDELFRHVMASEFCYVLTPRQMGKSSLMIRTAKRLSNEGVKSAIVDLTQIGTVQSEDQWYKGILSQIARRLRLAMDPINWWEQRKDIPNIQKFIEFFEEALAEVKEPVVIFMDEIDTTLKLDFRDNFFAGVRAIFNARAENPDLKRITFVLLGVASPSDLIKDRNRTPFNIGQEIPLRPFSREDARMLEKGLDEAYPNFGQKILDRVFYWTNGHPYLMQKICQSVVEIRLDEYDDDKIDELVEKLFITEEASRETNLQFVRDNILNYPERRVILSLYKKLLSRGELRDNKNSLPQNHLKLSGLARAEDGRLVVSNKIYSKVFNLTWVNKYTEVNWSLITSGVLGLIVIALGFVIYNDAIALPNKSRENIDNLSIYKDDRGIQYLADLFRMEPYIFPNEYEYKAKDTFFNTFGWDEQRSLIEIGYREPHPPPEDFAIVVSGLYTSLADVDRSSQTSGLLEIMQESLKEMKLQDNNLYKEITHWLTARRNANGNNLQGALEQYNQAIEFNPQNPATLFERARIYAELEQYENALKDYEQVVAIVPVSDTEPTSVPTSGTAVLTDIASGTSTFSVNLTPSFSPTQTSVQILATRLAPTVGSTTELPATLAPFTPVATGELALTPQSTGTPTLLPIQPKFLTLGQRIAAVNNDIKQNGSLTSFLSLINQSDYSNLERLGLLIIATPTPLVALPSQTVAVTSNPTEASLESTSVPPTEEPTIPPAIVGRGQIIFHSDRDSIGQIYRINQDSANEQRLTSLTDQIWSWYPAWSPSAEHIAFMVDQGGNIEIHIMDIVNHKVTNLTNNVAYDSRPNWSPDGKKIIFDSDRSGNFEIYTINVDGTGLTRITNNNCYDGWPSWSPDGTTIAYSSDCTGNLEIYLLVNGDEAPTQITNSVYEDRHPAWSPDGGKIAYYAGYEGTFDIYVMNADGSGITNITSDALNNQHPAWSPDGQQIAFQSDRSGNFDIYVMNIDGSDIRQITTHPAYDGEPAWSLH